VLSLALLALGWGGDMTSTYYGTTTNDIAKRLAQAYREFKTKDESLSELLGFAAKRLLDLEMEVDKALKGEFPYVRTGDWK
jgi:hypothetical protein